MAGDSLKQSEDISFPQDRNSVLFLSVSDRNRTNIHISFTLSFTVLKYFQTYGSDNAGTSAWKMVIWWIKLLFKTKFVLVGMNVQWMFQESQEIG
jgi:hypothetical protein